ncbi:hypothetical protein FOZ62_001660 [Perkinsus olseni]|uniref:Uncharacterized protein n=1 Tax=Perkinsus olseni TaxID=32597 RepID=A0A7J6U3F1_PEROL|nr:hypothetical protein FOZ62_001660 [Perkinsus olseni]
MSEPLPTGINVNNKKLISCVFVNGHRVYGNLRESTEEAITDLAVMKTIKKAGGTPKDLRRVVRSRRRPTKLPHHLTWGSYICRIMVTLSKGRKKAVYGSACSTMGEALEERDLLSNSKKRGASFDKLTELAAVFKTWRNSTHILKAYFRKWRCITGERKVFGREIEVRYYFEVRSSCGRQ